MPAVSIVGFVPMLQVKVVSSAESQESNHVSPEVVEEDEDEGCSDSKADHAFIRVRVAHNASFSKTARVQGIKRWILVWLVVAGA